MLVPNEKRSPPTTSSLAVERPIGESAVIRELCRAAYRYAATSAPVLLTGESGTGKEVFARYIQQASLRSANSYVRINCAALSESLIESELFGHERGAFTGALERRIGCFEFANGGTLLLDEISEIPLRLQAKLLRVLEEAEFQRVGGNESQPLDVRILATSNKCLETAVRKKRFRDDLFYRLNVLNLEVPPLRERIEDIPPLVHHFIQQFREESSTQVFGADSNAMEHLCRFQWPGNVRQLRNAIRRACVVADEPTIGLRDVEQLTKKCGRGSRIALADMKLKDVERIMIQSCLRRHHGNKTAAARQLGLTRRTLQNKMKEYGECARIT